MKTLLALLLAFSLGGAAMAAEGPQSKASAAPAKPHDLERCEAKVEQVFRTEEDGFVSIYYLATWHGQHVIIADAIHMTDLSVGDQVHFLAMWHDMSSKEKQQKLLHFEVVPY